MDLTLRIATPADTAAVAHVLVHSYPPLMAGAYDPGLLERALPLITRPHPRLLAGGTYYLAEADGEAVGCGGWSWECPGGTEVEPGLAHIRHFATHSGWTGRGIGRALYERSERDARAAGAERFECQASLNGEPFYAALGFARVGPIEVAMPRNVAFPSILMRRAI